MYIDNDVWYDFIDKLEKVKYFLSSTYLEDKFERIKFENIISSITNIRPIEYDEIDKIIKITNLDFKDLSIFRDYYIYLIEVKEICLRYNLTYRDINSKLKKTRKILQKNRSKYDNYAKNYLKKLYKDSNNS